MINKLKLVLSIGLVSIASNAFGFDIDINQDDLKRLKYGFLVEDLAVGEKAFVTTYAFCQRDGQLLLNKKVNIQERSKYSLNILITVNPKKTVTVNIKPEKDSTAFDLKDNLISDFIPQSNPCKRQEFFYSTVPDYYSVDNIDGYSSMSEYIKHLKDMGFKSKKETD
ncbi:hypothetical protein N9E53_06350 [Amylibacter sp.]|nr:hypothetical protein [Amylibacter sp.]|tara:strand:- start:66 stop:566 length:501 start_codon:yes stop_codon:yes gene_type:complete